MNILPPPTPAYVFTNIDQALTDLTNAQKQLNAYINLDANQNNDNLDLTPEYIRLNAAIGDIHAAIDTAWLANRPHGGNNKKNKARRTKRPRQTKRGKSRRRK